MSRARSSRGHRSRSALATARLLQTIGALTAECWRVGQCSVTVAREPMGDEFRWHLSIAHPSRYPTWDEIKTAVYGIDTVDGVTLAQVLGPVGPGEWVDEHPFCFHLYELHDLALATR